MYYSFIIPAYNESERLATSLPKVFAYIRERQLQAEVIVVNDGSSDDTAEATRSFASKYPEIRLLENPGNRGKGYSVRNGMLHANGDVLLFTDADLSSPIYEATKLFAAIEQGADVAIGSRWLDGSVVTYPQPLQRRVFSRLFNASVRSLFGLPYHDTQCGAKAFRRAAALQLAGVVMEKRWTFDVDLLVCSRFLGLDVSELPVVWADQAGSKLNVTKTLREVVSALWNMKRRDLRSALASRAYLPEEVRP